MKAVFRLKNKKFSQHYIIRLLSIRILGMGEREIAFLNTNSHLFFLIDGWTLARK
jgi:hypothetical protein